MNTPPLDLLIERKSYYELEGLAGYPAGPIMIGEERLHLRHGPALHVPMHGGWETIRTMIEGMLKHEQGIDQTPWFYGWLQRAVERLHFGTAGFASPSQALILAGQSGCGKSQLQQRIINALLGGRCADAGPWIVGGKGLNRGLFSCEHLIVEDLQCVRADLNSRVQMTERIKQVSVSDRWRLDLSRSKTVPFAPFWRLTISMSSEPEALKSMPLLTDDVKDKIMLLHLTRKPMPMPTDSAAQRSAFREQIQHELPAFLHWLLHEFHLPEALRCKRFGVQAFQHPALAGEEGAV